MRSDTPIFLDVDGVLADFNTGAANACGIPIQPDTFHTWDWFEKHDISVSQFWTAIEDTPEFWLKLETYEWAWQLVDLCEQYATVIFCTQPGRCHTGASQKIDWLRRNGLMLDRDNDYIVCGDFKHLLARSGGILIDDKPKNVLRFTKAGGKALLFPQPWNSNGIETSAEQKLGTVQRFLNSAVEEFV